MKKILELLIVIFTISSTVNAQEKALRPIADTKLYLYDGSQIGVSKITLKKPILSKNYFKNNEEKVYASNVQYYTNGRRFYANLSGNGGPFVQRIQKGNINMYSREVMTSSTFRNTTTYSKKTLYYFNVNDNALQKVKYKPILDIVYDNKSSMRYMNRFKTKRRASTITGISSALLFIGSIVSIVYRGDRDDDLETDPNYTLEYIGMGLGTGGLIATWVIGSNKDDLIIDAIRAYR